MAPSYTARLGLKKPAGIDNYNIGDNNGNADILDAFLPVTLCTAGTRPASPFNGQTIYETDTGRVYIWMNALSMWVPNILGSRSTFVAVAPGTAAAFLRADMVASATLAGNRFLDARLLGAANPGFTADFDGLLQWGPGGGTALDVNLYRDGVNVLATDDMLLSKHSAMQAQQVYDSVNRTTTSTTLTDTLSTGSALAITTVVPPSGKLLIGIANRMFPGTPPAVAQTTARISGTNTQTPDYSKTLSVSDATTDRRGLSWVATGLTAGGTVTVTMQHAIGSGTGNFDWRALTVVPLLA